MKTACLLIGMILAGSFSALAQGSIAANNQNTTPLTVVSRDGAVSNVVGTAGALLGQGSIRVSLWIATNGAPESALRLVAIGTNSTSSFRGAIGTFNMGNPLSLPSPWDGRVPVEIVFRAWSISTGATNWEAALGAAKGGKGYAGQSEYLRNFYLGAGGQAPMTFGPGLLQGLVLTQPR